MNSRTHRKPEPPPPRYSVQFKHANGAVEGIGITTDAAEACQWAKEHYYTHGLPAWVSEMETGKLIYQIKPAFRPMARKAAAA